MRQSLLRVLALAVIAMGGTYLTTQPAAASEASTSACCSDGTVLICGDTCSSNGDGTCTCD